ncbi:MAG: hypothetical protein HRT58_12295 [Crocinitomicaceae bacterium]|nr:hypothetical protein [Flavobacteriales bacterium]NQZ36442.1 hypothetical protein [Crocinitomicaceae bacterium]
MTKLIFALLINLISFSVFSQEFEPTQQDIETYRKLETGGFSMNFYLKAIIENKISDSSVLELEKKLEGGIEDMFCIGLISSLLNENHDGMYRNSQYFNRLNLVSIEGKLYFSQSTCLYGDKELFIWGTYGENESDITIHSAIGHNLEVTAYNSTFKTINNIDAIIFEANEQIAIIPIEGDTAFVLKYSVDEFEKIGTYRNCVLSCDTCIECELLQRIGKSEQVEIEQRVFTSELLIEDIDKNGTLDLYWFAVSNGELIKHDLFAFIDGVLMESKKDITDLIIETSRYDEMKKISLLEQIPKL